MFFSNNLSNLHCTSEKYFFGLTWIRNDDSLIDCQSPYTLHHEELILGLMCFNEKKLRIIFIILEKSNN